MTERYDKYDFNQAGISSYNFFWDEFADWAIEASKPRTYGDDAAAAARSRQVLVYVFDRVLRLLHPFMPFVTEELWQAIPHTGDALIAARWPTTGLPVDGAALAHFECLKVCVWGGRRGALVLPPIGPIGAVHAFPSRACFS